MNVYALGEESAAQMGVDTERFKTVLVATGALLTSVTVSVAGIIGFVGLIVPHMARRLARTPDHRRVLPLSIAVGALLMVLADTVARSIMPDGRELPVGVITAFLGAPFFCYLLRRKLAGARS
jgi:iron complex transport system permease protein